jgi:hypothetical protein
MTLHFRRMQCTNGRAGAQTERELWLERAVIVKKMNGWGDK